MSGEPLREGELAAVVTYLEMLVPPTGPPPVSSMKLQAVTDPSVAWYRALFRRVGGRWLWFSRLIMDDSKLAAILTDRQVELSTVQDEEGSEVGLLELDFRARGECELSFVGLIPEIAGQGHGRWLLAEALTLAWRDGVSRVHVHTCSLDHPAALPAYRRAGFRAYKRAIERFPDPRLLGILPVDCAPQVPLLGGTLVSAGSAES